MPSGATPAGGPPAPTDLTDEVTDAPQLFEYEDIAHSGHLMVKQVERAAAYQPNPNPALAPPAATRAMNTAGG